MPRARAGRRNPEGRPSARRRHGYRDRLRDGRHSGAPRPPRLFFIQMAKNREYSRPNREFKFRSCFGPAFGSVTNQDFCCGLSFEKAQLHFLYYNFVRIHQTLKMSPAMAAGVTKRLWEISDIVDMLEGWEQSGCARC
jgi:hypothetical protein